MKTLYILLLISVLTPLAFAQEPLDQLRAKEYITAREEIIAGKRDLVVTDKDIRSYIAKESIRFRKANPKFNASLNYIATNTGHYPYGRASFDLLWLDQAIGSGKLSSTGYKKKTEFFEVDTSKQDQIRLIAEALLFKLFPFNSYLKIPKRQQNPYISFLVVLSRAVKKDRDLSPELKAQIISAIITEYNGARSRTLVLPLKTIHAQIYAIINNIVDKYQSKIAVEVLYMAKLPNFYLNGPKDTLDSALLRRESNLEKNQQLMEFLAEKASVDNRFDIIMPFVKVYQQNFQLILDYDKRLSTNFAEQLLITLKSLNEKTPNDDLAKSIEYMTTTISQYTPNPDNVIETEKKTKKK